MKKLIIFILFISAVAFFIFLPVYAFRISDNAIYEVPLQRTAQWPPLSEEGEKNNFAKSMFTRKNVYGSRFLSWAADTTSNEDGLSLFLSKLKSLCDANVLSQELYTEIENEIKQPDTAASCFTDAMDFKKIQINFKDTAKSAVMEINTAANAVYSLQLSAENATAVSLDSFIEYLSLNSFTDWQRLDNKSGAYSANAQLYVYVQTQNKSYTTLGVFPMTQEEFKTYN